jgi:uncharacterized cysteine cluster protein YcgN (CxxCxxCC family)
MHVDENLKEHRPVSELLTSAMCHQLRRNSERCRQKTKQFQRSRCGKTTRRQRSPYKRIPPTGVSRLRKDARMQDYTRTIERGRFGRARLNDRRRQLQQRRRGATRHAAKRAKEKRVNQNERG